MTDPNDQNVEPSRSLSSIEEILSKQETPEYLESVDRINEACKFLEDAQKNLERRLKTLEKSPDTGLVDEVEKAEEAVRVALQAVKDAEYRISWMQGDEPAITEDPLKKTPTSAPNTQAPTATPVLTTETAVQRQARRYQMCIDYGLTMPTNDYARMPNGIRHVAAIEKVTRQAFADDLKKHINRMNGK
jgi:hypothetical protein